jgi:hypothetical protein
MPEIAPQYYVMKCTTAQGRGFDCLCEGIYNEQGECLDPALANESVSHAYALKLGREPLGDWIANTGGWLVLSERATHVFSEHAVCDSVRWVPLTIHDRQKKPLVEATLLYGPKQRDVLDLIGSEYDYFPNTDVIQNVTKWALQGDQIPPVDAFYTRQYEWIVTNVLHDAIENAQLTGFKFLVIENNLPTI